MMRWFWLQISVTLTASVSLIGWGVHFVRAKLLTAFVVAVLAVAMLGWTAAAAEWVYSVDQDPLDDSQRTHAAEVQSGGLTVMFICWERKGAPKKLGFRVVAEVSNAQRQDILGGITCKERRDLLRATGKQPNCSVGVKYRFDKLPPVEESWLWYSRYDYLQPDDTGKRIKEFAKKFANHSKFIFRVGYYHKKTFSISLEGSRGPIKQLLDSCDFVGVVKKVEPSLHPHLTISELDAIRRQIEGCWNIPAEARDAENLIVDISVVMNPDRTVQRAEIVERWRLTSDPFFRAAAESALRAVLHPRCSPLRLPPQKYQQWKTFTLSFNPKELIGR